MKHVRITDPHAADLLAVLDDGYITTRQEDEDMEREIAEVDALLESIERDLADDERTELVRVERDATDQVRARRARRRADRAVLRILPVRLPAAETPRGEAA